MYYEVREITQPTTEFFTESITKEQSVTEISESEMVKWLFTAPQNRKFLLKEFVHHYWSVRTFVNVQHPLTNQNEKPGDIDLLLIHPLHFHWCMAFECKKIKINSSDQYVRINNASKIKKAVIQANACRKLGFSLTYLIIIIQEDGSELTTPNVLLRQGKSPAIDGLYNLPYEYDLHKDIGVVFIYVSQITGRSVKKTYMLSISIDRPAFPQIQSPHITNNAISLYASPF